MAAWNSCKASALTRCIGRSQPKRPHTGTQTSQRTTSTGSPASSVAIPAVIFYNKLSSDADRLVGGYEAFADEFATILGRQLEA